MTARFFRCIVLIAAFGLMSSLASAECIVIPVDVPNLLRSSDLVFAGTLIKSDHQDQDRLTFRVDRIWKGRLAGRDVVVYQLDLPYVGRYVFQQGEVYLIFASALSAKDRQLAGLTPDEPVAFGIPSSCGAPPWPLRLTTELDKVAKARKPRD